MLAHVCPRLAEYSISKDNFTDESIYETMKHVSLQLGDIVEDWRQISDNLDTEILPIFHEDGICFTFNALNSHDMYTDEYVVAHFRTI